MAYNLQCSINKIDDCYHKAVLKAQDQVVVRWWCNSMYIRLFCIIWDYYMEFYDVIAAPDSIHASRLIILQFIFIFGRVCCVTYVICIGIIKNLIHFIGFITLYRRLMRQCIQFWSDNWPIHVSIAIFISIFDHHQSRRESISFCKKVIFQNFSVIKLLWRLLNWTTILGLS